MKLELLLILNDTEILHRSVSTVEDSINPYSAAINAIINELTGNVVKQMPVRVKVKESDRFKEAVPDYKPIIEQNKGVAFHPDLIKAGVAPIKPTEIPVVKLDMKTIFKDKK